MVKHWRTASRRLETIWVFMVRQQSCNNAIQDEDRWESDGWKTRRLRCLMSISFLRRQRKLNSCSNSHIPKSNYQNCHCWSIVIFCQSFYLNFVKFSPHLLNVFRKKSAVFVCICFVWNIHAESSCERWARCWSLQRRPPRPAASGSGWLHEAGAPAVSGRMCRLPMLPGWTGLGRQNRLEKDEGKQWLSTSYKSCIDIVKTWIKGDVCDLIFFNISLPPIKVWFFVPLSPFPFFVSKCLPHSPELDTE